MKTQFILFGIFCLMLSGLSAQTVVVDNEKPWKSIDKEGFYEMAETEVDSLIITQMYKKKFNGALLIVASLAVPSFSATIEGEEVGILTGITSALSTGFLIAGIVIMTKNRRKALYDHLTGVNPLRPEQIEAIIKSSE